MLEADKLNSNEFCFKCGIKNDVNNFAFDDTGGGFHIICLKCNGEKHD